MMPALSPRRATKHERFRRWSLMTALFGLLVVFGPSALPARAADAPLSAHQLQQLRSLLSNRCFACHGPDGDQRQAGFRLDQGDSAYQPADSGEVPIVPQRPDQSELLRRMTTEDADARMPPADFGKPLEAEEIELVRAWIQAGAPPLKHWSFVPPERPPLPQIARDAAAGALADTPGADLHQWLAGPIDRFVLAKQLEKELRPSRPASREVLLRRLSLDLTGLPPSSEMLDAFLGDARPDAIERAVDRLLASPEYGEHWARKWLDLARYADSAGYADDPERTIWAYRDWVVRAINADMPLDEFTIAQLAGDLLPDPQEDDLIATAFHRNTLTNNEGGTNDEEFRNVAIVDRVNTTMAVWMGVTFSCAQCHTHKYDPFTQEEYFKIYAIFNQSQDADRRDESPLIELYTDQQRRQRMAWQTRIEELRRELQSPSAEVSAEFAAWSASVASPTWLPARPQAFKAGASADAAWDEAGRVRVQAKQDDIATDTYTLQLSLPADAAGRSIEAIGIRTLPDASLPGGGAGRGGGNFVLTAARAAVLPAASNAKKARYVRLELPGNDRILSLAEVQAFAGSTNVALQGKATQSSTAYAGDAGRAIDGQTDGAYEKNSTTHTETTANPWWEVDLGSSQAIDRVVIWNRTDASIHSRLNGVQVSLLDEDRKPVSTETIAEARRESMPLDVSGATPIKFAAAYADFEQAGFPAAGAIDSDKETGWAVGGAIDSSHFLTLVPSAPIAVTGSDTLRLELAHESVHRNHLLASFEIVVSYESAAAHWAQMDETRRAIVRKPADQRTADEQSSLMLFFSEHFAKANLPQRSELAELEKQLAALKPATSVPVMRDLPIAQHRETHVQLRGNYKSLGDKVEPGLPKVFHAGPSAASLDRLQLAKWLMAPDNPLTARVMANRTWEALFGLGIVRSSEEFGSQGDLPSHPELLDWLATELMDLQWDSKRFLRMLVLSQTYQQTSEVTPANLEADADNVWLARGPRVRLTAESVRDQALAVSGLLSHKMFGAPVRPPQPSLGLSAAFGSKTDWETSPGEDRYRRGLYTSWRRSNPYPSMATFDAPSREVCTLRRDSTNTPLQALVTLNDPSFVEAAQALARRVVLVEAPAAGDNERLQFAFRACTSRPASDRELAALSRLLADARTQLATQQDAALKLATEPLGPLPAGADPVELAAWTAVSNVLLNLDEVLMKR